MMNSLNCVSGEVIVVASLPSEEEAKAGRERFCTQEMLLNGRELAARWVGADQYPNWDIVAIVTHKDEWVSGQRYTTTAEIYVTRQGLDRLIALQMGRNVFINVSPNCGTELV